MAKPPANPQATHASLTIKIAIAAFLLLALLFAYVAAGPYLAIKGIQKATEKRDIAALVKYINFEKLQTNMQSQLESIIATQIANRGGMLGSAASGAANVVAKSAAEGMASPAGIAILLEGDAMIKRARGDMQPGTGLTTGGPKSLDAFKSARTRYLSMSRFQATVDLDAKNEMDFIFEREGFSWKLANIKLPHPKDQAQAKP